MNAAMPLPLSPPGHVAPPLTPLRMLDVSGVWPSRSLGGDVHLEADGSWSSPLGSGRCSIGEVVTVDPSFPLYMRWTGRGWSRQSQGAGLRAV